METLKIKDRSNCRTGQHRLYQLCEQMSESQKHHLVCRIADSVVPLMDSERSRQAVEKKRAWINGDIGDDELSRVRRSIQEDAESRGWPAALVVADAIVAPFSAPERLARAAAMAFAVFALLTNGEGIASGLQAKDEAYTAAIKRYVEMAENILKGE